MIDERTQKWIDIFAALASDTRLEIARMLAQRKIECQEILGRLDLSQPAISYHLRKMEHAGILIKERKGSRNCYRLAERIQDLIRMIDKEEGR